MIDYIVIEVPDMNDSVSRVVLSGTAYNIRFTYNDTNDFWKFSLYNSKNEPIVVGIKLVPRIPLNVFHSASNFPDGFFGVMTKLDRVGRDDFSNGNAKFIFVPVSLQK